MAIIFDGTSLMSHVTGRMEGENETCAEEAACLRGQVQTSVKVAIAHAGMDVVLRELASHGKAQSVRRRVLPLAPARKVNATPRYLS